MKRLIAILTLFLIAAFIVSLFAGKAWLGPSELLTNPGGQAILTELRLPRAMLALVIGGVLGLSGAVLQGFLRNPLADPSLVGISSSAALGAVVAISLGLSVTPLWVFASAMAGAALALLLLIGLAGDGASPLSFILAGTVLSSLSGALTAFLISIATSPFATSEILDWLMGGLTDRSLEDAARAVPPMIAGAVILATTGRALDALSLGSDAARSLGIDLKRLQWTIAIGLCLGVGGAVAVSGVVGFVGLVVPHLVRQVAGERPSALLLPSALGGALLVVLGDALVRLTPGPGELHLGIAMSMIGAPFFFAMLLRLRRTLA